MPVQFNCTTCQSVIRTPDGSEGKQARCPKCNTIVTVPGGAVPPPATGNLWGEMPSSPPPGPPGGFPPSNYPPPGGYSPPAPQFNPYAAPAYGPSASFGAGPSREQSLAKLRGPAIGLIVCAVISIIYALVNGVIVIVSLANGEMEVPPGGPEQVGFYVGMVIGMLGVGVVPIVSLLGAIQMLRGKSYAWAMTGAIAGMLPCSACCVVGLVFGIWALVILNQPDVKQAFS